jgi:hypothetical protein
MFRDKKGSIGQNGTIISKLFNNLPGMQAYVTMRKFDCFAGFTQVLPSSQQVRAFCDLISLLSYGLLPGVLLGWF